MSKRSTAAALRRYRSEWQAALKRRDYVKARRILGAALSAVAAEGSKDFELESRALHELLALDRRVQAIVDGEAPPRVAPAKLAFALPSTREFGAAWQAAADRADYPQASRIVGEAIGTLSRRLLRRTRSQQAVIARLKRLQRSPLSYSPVPTRCSFCGDTGQPGVDSGRLFMCQNCVRMASAILAEEAEGSGERVSNRKHP